MSARTLHFITLTLSMVPGGWKRYQISWQLAVSCSPSPWWALSAALNRSSWSRAANTTVRTLNGSLKQTVVSCWALVAALVFFEWKECYKDFPPSVLGSLSVFRDTLRSAVVREHWKQCNAPFIRARKTTKWHDREATKLGLTLPMAKHQGLVLH